ncbi:putative ABC transporter ATP-binding protein YbbL [compost metagenome]
MIPWSMKFSGIRDYPSTSLDLSGRNAHILITGPNGAGKSTITYCMGAVLYSSKVELEGLRSRNLGPDETWKANIRFLFKNDGNQRIDAPDYIEFSLRIQQDPGQPIKKEFHISSGDVIDDWEESIRYTSGDRQYNFTAYKKDLQYKYKVDPDLFYLIWYQQEVNQFAVMHPEERFRIFAEMHGIDQVQQNWEEGIEKLKEAQESLRLAENNVLHKKQLLNIKKTELDRYEDNKRRLLEGGKLYTESLLQMEAYLQQQQKELTGIIDQLQLELDQLVDQIDELLMRETDMNDRLSVIQQEIDGLDAEYNRLEELHTSIAEEIKETQAAIAELEQELQEISNEKDRITRTETEVEHQIAAAMADMDEIEKQSEDLQQQVVYCEEQQRANNKEIAALDYEIEQETKQEKEHKERLYRYGSSYQVQEELDQLEQSLHLAKDQRYQHMKRIGELKEELVRLEEERDWSKRQMKSIAYFQARGIRVYALRELVELDETAKLKYEEKYNAIKYSMFFDDYRAVPPNDLYHVPLRKIIPDRSVTELPELHLRVKAGLKEEIMPHAMKALWWVEQFFKGELVQIENGVLMDSMGLRGSQENNRYILSVFALAAHKQEITKMVAELAYRSEQLEEQIRLRTKRLQELNSIIHQVREAEAFMTQEHERVDRIRKLEEEKALQDQLLEQARNFGVHKAKLMKRQFELEHLRDELSKEAEFYVKLGQQKAKYELLFAKKNEHLALKEKHDHLNQVMEQHEEMLENMMKKRKAILREVEKIQHDKEREEYELQQMKKQREFRKESLDSVKDDLVVTMQEIETLKKLVPSIYEEAAQSLNLELDESLTPAAGQQLSISKIRTDIEKGRIQFDTARHEQHIDPQAPENYRVIEEEWHRLQDEHKRMLLLFEENQQRTEDLKDQLERTTNMRVIQIQKLFSSYMSQFQFEGDIDWVQYEDSRNRTRFELYIKARKEGHRGAMEDVSVKARGGRVGKGVSGGEESLSSLLFALALLQNLQTAPDFIVLDEFDSALDEQRKLKVFDLYASELERKLIILTPKSHEQSYLDRFSKAYVVHHDPTVPRSRVMGLLKKD